MTTNREFTKEEIEIIYEFHEIEDKYAFDMWDYVLNKEDNESLNDYLKRQKITDIKIVEYMKSIKYE